jgi:hypothetical protein
MLSEPQASPVSTVPNKSQVTVDSNNHESILAADKDTQSVMITSDGFRVADENTANWLVRKILEARAYAVHVEEWAAAEKQRAKRDEQRLLLRFGPELEQWLRTEIQTRGNRSKSVALPAGRISLRRVNGRMVIADEAVAMQWAKDHLVDAVKINISVTGSAALHFADCCKTLLGSNAGTFQVIKSVLAEHIARTGEIPDGVNLESSQEHLLIR